MTPEDAATTLSAPEGSVDPVTFFDYLFRMTPEERDTLCNRLDGQESADYARTTVVNLLREHATVIRGVKLSYNLSCNSISSGEDPNFHLWFYMSDMGEWMTRDFVEHNHRRGNHDEPAPTEDDYTRTQNAVDKLYTKLTGLEALYRNIKKYEEREAERKSGKSKNAQVTGK